MHMVAIGEEITLVSEGWSSMAHPDLALRPLTEAEDIVPCGRRRATIRRYAGS